MSEITWETRRRKSTASTTRSDSRSHYASNDTLADESLFGDELNMNYDRRDSSKVRVRFSERTGRHSWSGNSNSGKNNNSDDGRHSWAGMSSKNDSYPNQNNIYTSRDHSSSSQGTESGKSSTESDEEIVPSREDLTDQENVLDSNEKNIVDNAVIGSSERIKIKNMQSTIQFKTSDTPESVYSDNTSSESSEHESKILMVIVDPNENININKASARSDSRSENVMMEMENMNVQSKITSTTESYIDERQTVIEMESPKSIQLTKRKQWDMSTAKSNSLNEGTGDALNNEDIYQKNMINEHKTEFSYASEDESSLESGRTSRNETHSNKFTVEYSEDENNSNMNDSNSIQKKDRMGSNYVQKVLGNSFGTRTSYYEPIITDSVMTLNDVSGRNKSAAKQRQRSSSIIRLGTIQEKSGKPRPKSKKMLKSRVNSTSSLIIPRIIVTPLENRTTDDEQDKFVPKDPGHVEQAKRKYILPKARGILRTQSSPPTRTGDAMSGGRTSSAATLVMPAIAAPSVPRPTTSPTRPSRATLKLPTIDN